MLSRRLQEVEQAAQRREKAPCARRSRSNAAGRVRTRTTRYARGSPRTRARVVVVAAAGALATSVDPRLRPCGADINSESSSSPPLALSSPPPALLSPQARSSPPPALSPPPELSPFPLSSLMLLAEWTPERSLSTSTVRTEPM